MSLGKTSTKRQIHGTSLGMCPNGHIMLRFGVATVHLAYDELKSFLSKAQAFVDDCEKRPEVLLAATRAASPLSH